MPDYTIIAGQGVHCTSTTLSQWDGGESSDPYNSIGGTYGTYSYFKRYLTAGTYTVTGAASPKTVLVTADSRTVVSANTSSWTAFKTQLELLANDTIVEIPSGTSLVSTTNAVAIRANNVTIRVTGSGSPAVITRNVGNGPGIFAVYENNFTVDGQVAGLKIQSNKPYSTYGKAKVDVYAFEAHANNLIIANCSFADIDCIFNNSSNTIISTGLALINCTADGTMRAVSTWFTGNQNAVIGCTLAGLNEATMRSSMNGLLYTLICNNTITATSAQAKEAISCREGQFFSIVNNTIFGLGYAAIRIGDVPVGSISPQAGWTDIVVSDNTFHCPTSYAVAVNAGAQNITIGTNVIHMSDSKVPIVVGNVTYGRYTLNVHILDNQVFYSIGINPSGSLLDNIYEEDAHNPGVTAAKQLTASGNTIGARPPTIPRLAFSVQPSNIIAGATIPVFKVAIIDGSNAVITGDTSTVTIISAATLTGTTSVAAVAGIATFSNISTDSFGTFNLIATDGVYSAANSTPFSVSAAAPPPIIPPPVVPTPPVTPVAPVVPVVPIAPVLSPCQIFTYADLAYALRIDPDLDSSQEESLVLDYQCAAVEYAESLMGCSLLTRTITKTFWNHSTSMPEILGLGAAYRHIQLYGGPIQSITSVTDAKGLIDPTKYQIQSFGAADYLYLNTGVTAPLTVVYVAGYGDDPSDIPADIRQAIRSHVATLYERRESATDRTITAVPHSLEAFYRAKSRTVGVR